MLAIVRSQIKIALLLLLLLAIITGVIYPVFITIVAKTFYPWHANGSLLVVNNKTIGSKLIGQYFVDSKYFWGRPSSTSPYPYNAASSTGSNLALSNPEFFNLIKGRVDSLKKAQPKSQMLIPIDLVTSSASGLDPEISPLAAYYQIPRIAKARHLSEKSIKDLVDSTLKNRIFGAIGEQRVNVLILNLALDSLITTKG